MIALAYGVSDFVEDGEEYLPVEAPVRSCRMNLQDLGLAFVRWQEENPDATTRGGPGLLLALRQDHLVPPGAEETFICPADRAVLRPITRDERLQYDDIDPERPSSFQGMTSYAARDLENFPLGASGRGGSRAAGADPTGASRTMRRGSMSSSTTARRRWWVGTSSNSNRARPSWSAPGRRTPNCAR